MTTIYYTKRFTSGLLKDISVNQNMTFDSARMEQVTKHICKGAKGRDVITHDRWIITDASFQNYAR